MEKKKTENAEISTVKAQSKSDKTVAESNYKFSRIETVVSLLLMCIASVPLVFITINALLNKTGGALQTGIIVICILVIAFAFIMFNDGFKRNLLLKLFRNYVQKLSSDPDRSMVTLAKLVKVDGKTVRNNIEYLIEKGWFRNTKVDLKNKRVVFGDEVKAPSSGDYFAASLPMTKCKYCKGLNYDPKGNLETCYYCGSKIKRKQ